MVRPASDVGSEKSGPITYGDLATLMAMFPTDIRTHIDEVARGNRSLIPLDLPTDLAAAVGKTAEINEWAILHVANDPTAELPSGPAASELLRNAWNPTEATFEFCAG